MNPLTPRQTLDIVEIIDRLNTQMETFQQDLAIEQAKRQATGQPLNFRSMEAWYMQQITETQDEIDWNVHLLTKYGHRGV